MLIASMIAVDLLGFLLGWAHGHIRLWEVAAPNVKLLDARAPVLHRALRLAGAPFAYPGPRAAGFWRFPGRKGGPRPTRMPARRG
jgi:hypothetical protein